MSPYRKRERFPLLHYLDWEVRGQSQLVSRIPTVCVNWAYWSRTLEKGRCSYRELISPNGEISTGFCPALSWAWLCMLSMLENSFLIESGLVIRNALLAEFSFNFSSLWSSQPNPLHHLPLSFAIFYSALFFSKPFPFLSSPLLPFVPQPKYSSSTRSHPTSAEPQPLHHTHRWRQWPWRRRVL